MTVPSSWNTYQPWYVLSDVGIFMAKYVGVNWL